MSLEYIESYSFSVILICMIYKLRACSNIIPPRKLVVLRCSHIKILSIYLPICISLLMIEILKWNLKKLIIGFYHEKNHCNRFVQTVKLVAFHKNRLANIRLLFKNNIFYCPLKQPYYVNQITKQFLH